MVTRFSKTVLLGAFFLPFLVICSCSPRVGMVELSTSEDEQATSIIEQQEDGQTVFSTIGEAQAYVLLGKANLQLEDYEAAIRAFLDALVLEPALNDQIYPFLAEAYQRSACEKLDARQYEQAVEGFRSMLDLDFRLLEEEVDHIVDAYIGYARAMDARGAADAAFSSYSDLQAYSPNNAVLMMGQGRMAFTVGRYTQAITAFSRAKELDASLAGTANTLVGRVYAARGAYYLKQGAYGKAIINLTAAVRANPRLRNAVEPQLVAAYLSSGTASKDAGDIVQAEQQWQRCLELSPFNAEALRRLGALYLTAGKSAQAAEVYARLFELEPDNLEILRELADLAWGLEKYERAEQLYAQLVDRDSSKVFTRYYKLLGQRSFDRGEYAAAATRYGLYVASYPGDAEAAYQLSLAFSFQKKYAAALDFYRKAVAIDASWAAKGGQPFGFHLYRFRLVIIALFVFALLGMAGGFLFWQNSRKIVA